MASCSNTVVEFQKQNAHTSIVNDTVVKYKCILKANISDSANPLVTLDDIKNNLLNRLSDDPESRERIQMVLDKISEGRDIGFCFENVKEPEVLLNVWKRMHSLENAENLENLKDSLIWALKESAPLDLVTGNFAVVGSIGRCARIIDILTFADANQHIASPIGLVDALRNEAFIKAHFILQQHLTDAGQEVMDEYNNSDANNEISDQIQQLKDNVKQAIECCLREDYPHIDSNTLDKVINAAKAGV